jgi:hypothetical protein
MEKVNEVALEQKEIMFLIDKKPLLEQEEIMHLM